MPSHTRNEPRARRGFTLIELAAVIALGSVVMAQLMPISKRARNTTRGVGSAVNLMQIGQAAGMYGVDNADRIPSYTVGLDAGTMAINYTLPDGNTIRIRSDDDGSSAQITEILQRRTGRIDGDFAITHEDSRLPQRRFTNLIIQDYLGSPLFDEVFIDPADASLIEWSSSPFDYGVGSSVPYANVTTPDPGYDDDANWLREGIRQRWAFGSSYQAAPAAWQPDGIGVSSYVPVADTPHLFTINRVGSGVGQVELSDGRRFAEVRYPANKVYQFEEHDREQAGEPYFAYDHARPEKLMFDGSVNSLASGEAGPSWNVVEGKVKWRQTYVPLDTFPVPLGGLGDDTLLSQRYRWTLGGLRGVDYATHFSTSR